MTLGKNITSLYDTQQFVFLSYLTSSLSFIDAFHDTSIHLVVKLHMAQNSKHEWRQSATLLGVHEYDLQRTSTLAAVCIFFSSTDMRNPAVLARMSIGARSIGGKLALQAWGVPAGKDAKTTAAAPRVVGLISTVPPVRTTASAKTRRLDFVRMLS
jgi:hypothetical protein